MTGFHRLHRSRPALEGSHRTFPGFSTETGLPRLPALVSNAGLKLCVRTDLLTELLP